MTAAKATQKRILFRKWQLVAATIIGTIMWLTWGVTFQGMDFALDTTPRYFPEAPLWHIGLYIGGFIALTYAGVGAFYLWLERMEQRRASSSP